MGNGVGGLGSFPHLDLLAYGVQWRWWKEVGVVGASEQGWGRSWAESRCEPVHAGGSKPREGL